jgi:RNA polymerase sigma-70 factor (ECF subfamily)
VRHLSESDTHVTLLGRLRSVPNDPVAWAEFVQCYGRKIYAWCRAWGLQKADAQDVTQEVFLKLTCRIQDFHYNPSGSFRAWLKTVTHHAWQDYLDTQRRPGQGSGGGCAIHQLAAIEARDDLTCRLEEAFDQEVLREAIARVRLRVEPRTWDAFRLLAIEELSGAEAANRLGMKVATVFVARSKVERMLRQEIARLEQD